jgi:uncharacterized protein YjbI with pentapeptide repeats
MVRDVRSISQFIEFARHQDPARTTKADIDAVLQVISRRSGKNRERERRKNWHIDLRGADLRGALLVEAQLEEAWLDETHLEGAWLMEAHLHGAMLVGAHLQGAWLTAAHLEKTGRLPGASLTNANLEGANLRLANLKGVSLNGAQLQRADLSGASLIGADLRSARLENVRIDNVSIEGTTFNPSLEGAQLANARISRTNLMGVKGLTQEQLDSAAVDAHTTLPPGLFKNPTFLLMDQEPQRLAYFKNLGDLSEANLARANLTQANLQGFNLCRTNLEGAVLSEANLEGANLSGANLKGTDLRGAEGLSEAQLKDAFGDLSTQLPDGMIRPTSWLITESVTEETTSNRDSQVSPA